MFDTRNSHKEKMQSSPGRPSFEELVAVETVLESLLRERDVVMQDLRQLETDLEECAQMQARYGQQIVGAAKLQLHELKAAKTGEFDALQERIETLERSVARSTALGRTVGKDTLALTKSPILRHSPNRFSNPSVIPYS
jgi:hypothetical protein